MLVKMVRDAKAHPESHEANVAQEQVAEFEAMGWSVEGAKPALSPAQVKALDGDGDGAAGGSLPRARRKKSGG